MRQVVTLGVSLGLVYLAVGLLIAVCCFAYDNKYRKLSRNEFSNNIRNLDGQLQFVVIILGWFPIVVYNIIRNFIKNRRQK